MIKNSVTIIGGGAAAIMLAAFIDERKYEVTIFEKNKALGRKLLVAGKGGFNLTHSKKLQLLLKEYVPYGHLDNAINGFSNIDLRHWLSEIGIETYIGSSKRVFPKEGIKPIEVLKAMEQVLKAKNVSIKYGHEWIGWEENNVAVFSKKIKVPSDIIVYALGGSSWSVTGSDGLWLNAFKSAEIPVAPFQSSNCGAKIKWPNGFLAHHEGKPIKNISLSCDGKSTMGEFVITNFGMEGSALYSLSNQIRKGLNSKGEAKLLVDLKPSLSAEEIYIKLTSSIGAKRSNTLRQKLKLSPAQVALLKAYIPKQVFIDDLLLSKAVKAIELRVLSLAPIDEAISTVGGVPLNALDDNFQLISKPNQYCIGEMLDWDAPTGGYLLQACFSMGVYLARHLNGLRALKD